MTRKAPYLTADAWPGATLLTGGKGYAPTPMGQVHYRDVGPRDAKPVFLLLHQSQMSMIQYGEIQNRLAADGRRSLALDTPGHGLSDLPAVQPTLEELVDTLVAVLDHLDIDTVAVAGHHSGAAFAVSLAARYPQRVAALVVHGAPLFDEGERADLLAMKLHDRTPRADGSHMGAWFRAFPGDIPDDPKTLGSRTWMMVSMFLMGPDVGKPAVFAYDLAADALRVGAPTLILTDRLDPMHPRDERLSRLRPDFVYRVFSEHGPMTMMNDPARWARTVADFVDGVVGPPAAA